jgi:hypothetical protein
VTINGRYVATLSGAVTVNAVNLSPLLLDARLLALSDQYQYYRFTAVRFHLFPNSGSDAVPAAIGYVPGLLSAAPASQQDMADLPLFQMGNGDYGLPWPRIVVSKNLLMKSSTAPAWYRRGTGYDDLLEVQGTMYSYLFGSTFATFNCFFIVEYTIQLADPAAAADTLAIKPVPEPGMAANMAAVRRSIVEREEEKLQTLKERLAAAEMPHATDFGPMEMRDGMVVVNQPITPDPTPTIDRTVQPFSRQTIGGGLRGRK